MCVVCLSVYLSVCVEVCVYLVKCKSMCGAGVGGVDRSPVYWMRCAYSHLEMTEPILRAVAVAVAVALNMPASNLATATAASLLTLSLPCWSVLRNEKTHNSMALLTKPDVSSESWGRASRYGEIGVANSPRPMSQHRTVCGSLIGVQQKCVTHLG